MSVFNETLFVQRDVLLPSAARHVITWVPLPARLSPAYAFLLEDCQVEQSFALKVTVNSFGEILPTEILLLEALTFTDPTR